VLIANAAECEPVLVTDQWVMFAHASEIAEALRAVGEAVGARRVVFAVKHKYAPQIAAIGPFLHGSPRIELFEIGDFYPAGDEHVLVHEVTGRVVPEGGIPLEVGVVVQNVATLLGIHAAMRGLPVIEKHVTVAGEVARPGVYIAPIGTPARDLIAAAGGTTRADVAFIEGGPMMGTVFADLSRPVTKTTSGFLVVPAVDGVASRLSSTDAREIGRGMATCCGCRMCTDLCPRALLGHRIAPHLAMRAIDGSGETPRELLAMSALCSLCGVCESWSCPMGLSPRRVFKVFKGRAAAQKLAPSLRNTPDHALERQAWARVPKQRLSQRLGLYHYTPPGTGTFVRVPPPASVCIPLKQHVGAPALPVVKPGDRVRAGDLAAEIPPGALGARVHASMDGVVTAVDARSVTIARS